MRVSAVWLLLACAPLSPVIPLADAAENLAAVAPDSSVRGLLRSAVAAYDRKERVDAEFDIVAAIDDPAFSALDESLRHAALVLASQATTLNKHYALAQRYAVLATQMPQQTLDEWKVRLYASMQLDDPRDEAYCLTTIAREYGLAHSNMPNAYIRRVLADTMIEELAPDRFDMLAALYDIRWATDDGGMDAWFWRDYARMLLERGEKDRAIQAAALVKNPYDVIGMRVDLRFRPLLKSGYVLDNPEKAAQSGVNTIRRVAQQRPRSLGVLGQLAHTLLSLRRDTEALALTEGVDRQIAAAGKDISAYDDIPSRYGFILDLQSRALVHLGRFDDAVAVLRRAVADPKGGSAFDTAINLAELLCELNRPEEAFMVLPETGNVSPYGLMRITLVAFTIALERQDVEAAGAALSYMRTQLKKYPDMLQRALARAGEDDEAEQLLLWRLNDKTLRTSTLIRLQTYASETRPALAAEWQERELALRSRPRVREVLERIGRIERYPWLNNYRDD